MEENKITKIADENTAQNEMAGTCTPKFCPNCGAPVNTDAKFCTKCGAPVKSNDCVINTSASVSKENAVQAQKSNKKKNKKIAIIVAAVVLIIAIIAGVALGLIYLKNAKMEEQIMGVWSAEAIVDEGEYQQLHHGAGFLDYKLVLEDDLTGYIYLSSLTNKSDNINFSWKYYKSKYGYDYFDVKAGDNSFALISYNKQTDVICFVLIGEEEHTVVYTRE